MGKYNIECISKSDLKVFVVDGIIDDDVLIDIESKCPDIDKFDKGLESEEVNYITKTPVSKLKLPYDFPHEYLNVPPTESYFNEGVVVNPYIDKPDYFNSHKWKSMILDIIGGDIEKMDVGFWQYRTNLKKTNGLWLHTDKNVPNKSNRLIEVLIYPNNEKWIKDFGGELLIFSNENKIDNIDRECIDEWQTERLLFELSELELGDIIRTKGISGGWPFTEKAVDFKLEKKIEPLFGRVIILDYRENYNIHAVAPQSDFNRKSIESWFNYGR